MEMTKRDVCADLAVTLYFRHLLLGHISRPSDAQQLLRGHNASVHLTVRQPQLQSATDRLSQASTKQERWKDESDKVRVHWSRKLVQLYSRIGYEHKQGSTSLKSKLSVSAGHWPVLSGMRHKFEKLRNSILGSVRYGASNCVILVLFVPSLDAGLLPCAEEQTFL